MYMYKELNLHVSYCISLFPSVPFQGTQSPKILAAIVGLAQLLRCSWDSPNYSWDSPTEALQLGPMLYIWGVTGLLMKRVVTTERSADLVHGTQAFNAQYPVKVFHMIRVCGTLTLSTASEKEYVAA